MIAMNKELFQSTIREEKPVLVEFWAPWCTYCRRIAPALAKVDKEYEGVLAVAQVNIDEAPEVAEMEGIELVPTMVIYRGGQALGSIVAPDSKAKIDSFIKQTLSI